MDYLAKNLQTVREQIRETAREAGRDPAEICMVAAVKSAEIEEINRLHDLGVDWIGENRVQQLLAHWDGLRDRDGLQIHFIGQLQSNKVKYIIDKVCLIQSLDSAHLAAEIEKQSALRNKQTDVLVEINSGREENKGGILPEDAEAFCLSLVSYPHIRLRGFMTMAPKCQEREEYAKYFRQTNALCLDIWYKKLHNNYIPIISMGMSDSFQAAISCGATMVRIGRTLFQGKNT